MASTIILRTISAAPETAIHMDNSAWARPVTLPSTWSKIRVGIRCHCVGTTALSGVSFALGFSSGTSGMIGDYSTTNFVGMICSQFSTVGGGSQLNFGPLKAATKVGTTLTLGGDISTAGNIFMPANVAATADRELFFCDITKGSPNFTVNAFFPSVNGGIPDVSAADFLTQMQAAVPASAQHSAGTPQAIAFSESNGVLNAATCWWSSSVDILEVCDLAVVLLA